MEPRAGLSPALSAAVERLEEIVRRRGYAAAASPFPYTSRLPEGKESLRGTISSGIPPLDAMLPAGGFRRGSLVEWLDARQGSGAALLAFQGALQALRQGGMLVVLDSEREFYPPAALGQGIEYARLVVLRIHEPDDGIWALEQVLRCPGVAAVVARIARLPDRAFRRLQLAAEAGGGLGLLLRPPQALRTPSWAEIRLWIGSSPPPFCSRGGAGNGSASDLEPSLPSAPWRRSKEKGLTGHPSSPHDPRERPLSQKSWEENVTRNRLVRVEVLRCPKGKAGAILELECDEQTGDVRLAAPLVHSASARHAERVPGKSRPAV